MTLPYFGSHRHSRFLFRVESGDAISWYFVGPDFPRLLSECLDLLGRDRR